MTETLSGMAAIERFLQPLKAELLTFFRFAGIVTSSSEESFAKAYGGIVSSASERTAFFQAGLFPKAHCPTEAADGK